MREIGSGSHGTAILVKDGDGKLCVLKSIDISDMDARERRDAVNEVRVLSSLRHPYVVSYKESFLENNLLCIVMDYADGGDLYQRISRTRKAGQTFSEQQVIRWFTQAVLGLKHMHERMVLHRDLKSKNLFLTSSGRLRIGDFGIAKVLDSTTAFAKTAIGTPYYLSPEICEERPYSWSSDVWAIGCILYEVCALRVPFDAPNIGALVTRITQGQTPTIPSRYSAELHRLCSDILQRDPERRPSSKDLLRYAVIQREIRCMLKEERDKQGENWRDESGKGDERTRDARATRSLPHSPAQASYRGVETTSRSRNTVAPGRVTPDLVQDGYRGLGVRGRPLGPQDTRASM